jgi:hypothetical protein
LTENVGDTESYDVFAVSPSLDEVHVEVKGSAVPSMTVELTDGEVKHWSDDYVRALFVVDEVKWRRTTDGSIRTSGGTLRHWMPWDLDSETLSPTRYRYTLPAGG